MTLTVVAIAVFLLIHVSGSSIEFVLLPPEATAEQRAALRHELHLDEPLPLQLARFLVSAIQGDFGTSLYYQRPALSIVADRLQATLELAVAGTLFAVVLSLALGILAAVFEGSWFDSLVGALASAGQSMPSFWLGIMLILLFGVNLHWLPTSGRGTLQQLIMPVVTLAVVIAPQTLLLTRASLLDVLHDPYIVVARAKGLSERTLILRHALPNALTPVIASIGLVFGHLVGGAVLTETVFAWPGIGRLSVQAVSNRDLPLVEASVLVLALGVLLSSLVVDLVTTIVDPRVRFG